MTTLSSGKYFTYPRMTPSHSATQKFSFSFAEIIAGHAQGRVVGALT